MAVADRTETYGELEYARAQLRLYMYLRVAGEARAPAAACMEHTKSLLSDMAFLAEGHWQSEPNHWPLPPCFVLGL